MQRVVHVAGERLVQVFRLIVVQYKHGLVSRFSRLRSLPIQPRQ